MSGFQIQREVKAHNFEGETTIVVDEGGYIRIDGRDIEAGIGGKAWDEIVAAVEMLRSKLQGVPK